MLDDNILSHYGKLEYWEERYARYIKKYHYITFNLLI